MLDKLPSNNNALTCLRGNLAGKARYPNTKGRLVLSGGSWTAQDFKPEKGLSSRWDLLALSFSQVPGEMGKFWLSFQLPRILAKPRLSIHSKSFFFLFSPKTHQHRNNHWKSIELWKNNKPWQNEACLNILILQTLSGHPLRARPWAGSRDSKSEKVWGGISLEVQGLGLYAFTSGVPGSIPGQGIPQNKWSKKSRHRGWRFDPWSGDPTSYVTQSKRKKKKKAIEVHSTSPNLETQRSCLLWRYMPDPHLTHFLHWLKE